MKRSYVHVGAAIAVALLLSFPALGQITQPAPRTATVIGTVTDLNGGVIPNARVVLREAQNNQPTTILATRNWLFQFNDVAPGSTFQLSISAKDFRTGPLPL